MTVNIGSLDNVPAPGDPIRSPWAQEISGLARAVFATKAALDAGTAAWAGLGDGATAYTVADKRQWTRHGAAWICTGGEPLYAARAWRNAALNIAAAPATTLIAFDSETYDHNNNFDLATGRYTCPVAGLMQVVAHVPYGVLNNPDQVQLGLYYNATVVAVGSRRVDRSATGGDVHSLTLNATHTVAAGGLLDVRVEHITGPAADGVTVGQAQCWAEFRKVPA